MKRVKGINGRVYHLLEEGRSSYPLCSKYISREARKPLTAEQVGNITLCKDCERKLNRKIDELLVFTSETPPEPRTRKPSSKFDEFLTELEDLTQEYGEEETIFGMQILTLKKRYRKA